MRMRKIYYRRYKRIRLYHFCPAPGYNCPHIPLGSVNSKGSDYEIVKVVSTEGDCEYLKGKRVLISWGLNLNIKNQQKVKQVLAVNEHALGAWAEIVLAVN